MSVQSPDLISELLRGMRLSGVKYRRIEASAPFGVAFHQAPGKAQFHFVSHGTALLRMESGATFELNGGDALFIPNGNAHVLLSDEHADITPVSAFPSEPLCHSVCAITCEPSPEKENTIIFSGCMDFELGGMQPLIKAMPEVMMVSRLMSTWPEIHPLLAAMERESMTRQVGFAGILARLADVVAALIVRGWVEAGCGKATGWVQVLRDPRLSRAIYAMHQQPGLNWSVADLAKEAGTSRSVFAERFLSATGTTPARYLTELRMRLAIQYIRHENQAIETVALRLGYGSLAAFSRAFKRIVGHAPGALKEASQPPEAI
ncbi:AraC family transcriptional regulator [Enterobacter hormaechei]|uniref:AraC family transcriptional regulator n=1 Tax=Enterobacter cloacae complex TaxID=354276 RepID=UPI00063C426E|nr:MULTISPECIES: AraC family transcriptional regulator [Enterobacter cloacae complex]AVF15594.1 transcriptional regulator FtrA [Enterobacter cloacae complex sp.]QLV54529.1 AraC family transcriptional regulator [Enterobacter cloacae]AOP82954.1 AraC family transcriptional regulator [Enterobacter hormaechei subsp. oharae]EHE7790745.1 AraC family transcriptional regulator [Enterobacter hormaechei]ELC6402098.1 AraC family transcriptional regulator [Enterobacter hormaechei]